MTDDARHERSTPLYVSKKLRLHLHNTRRKRRHYHNHEAKSEKRMVEMQCAIQNLQKSMTEMMKIVQRRPSLPHAAYEQHLIPTKSAMSASSVLEFTQRRKSMPRYDMPPTYPDFSSEISDSQSNIAPITASMVEAEAVQSIVDGSEDVQSSGFIPTPELIAALEPKAELPPALPRRASLLMTFSQQLKPLVPTQLTPAFLKEISSTSSARLSRVSMSLNSSTNSRAMSKVRHSAYMRRIPIGTLAQDQASFKNKKRKSCTISMADLSRVQEEDSKMHWLSISHESINRSRWDWLVMILIVIDITLTPFSVGFHVNSTFIRVMNVVNTIVFCIDFVVNLLSSYTTERGMLISGPKKTVAHYLFGFWALPDFLSWFPFEYVVKSGAKNRFFNVSKVIRLAKASQLARRMHSAKKAGTFRFIRLIGAVLLVSHVATCFWHLLAVDWRRSVDGWDHFSLGQKYARCWFIIIGCLSGNPPSTFNEWEDIFTSIILLLGNVIQASVFGSVAVLISSFDEGESAYNKKLISTYERCKFLEIPEELSKRVREYYENLYRETKSVDPDADSFIQELSPALVCEIKFQLYREMLEQIPFLSPDKLDGAVIELLVLHLRTEIYMQDDIVIRKGEYGDWMGFIGSKGSVGVLNPSLLVRKVIRILRKGDYFGEMALLQRSKRSTTAIALTWVQIHVLRRSDLDDVKAYYPDQAEILETEINKYMASKVKYQ